MRHVAPVLVFLAGCAGGRGSAPPGESLLAKVNLWLEAAARAHETRTHASGEHPAAAAEMARIEGELRKEDAARVREAVEELRTGMEALRREVEGRRNSILVAGRAHTPEDQLDLERHSRAIERIDLSERLLRDLVGALDRPGKAPPPAQP